MKTLKPKILVILGPTATGKSDLAVKLAKRFNGEVVSADSRQIYKGLNIGTGKITKTEMKGVKHHMLDVANPKKQYSVSKYAEEASRAIAAIARRSHLPIICGGTGFYISALVDGFTLPDVPPNLKLRASLSKKSAAELFHTLKKLDPHRAASIDPKNKVRLIRGLEIIKTLGSVPHLAVGSPSKYQPLFIGLTLPPEKLRQKISSRLFARMGDNMVGEAKRLHKKGLSWKRMNELGLEYRYLSLFLQNKISKDEMTKKLQTEIWRYAKRQMTWFKRDKRIKWYFPSDANQIKKEVLVFLKI